MSAENETTLSLKNQEEKWVKSLIEIIIIDYTFRYKLICDGLQLEDLKAFVQTISLEHFHLGGVIYTDKIGKF